MSCQVFISYRRDDSNDATTWLYEQLKNEFGPDFIFMDKNSIEPASLWNEDIASKIEAAEILLIIIGKEWLTKGIDDFGRRRIDDEKDWVRKEIESALKAKKTILPVLINDAKMPPAEALPDSIKILPNYQYIKVRIDGKQTSGLDELTETITRTINRKNNPDELREKLEQILDSEYEIVKQIGAGEMFKVYQAKDTALERYVTVRAIQDPTYNNDFIETLKDAAKIVDIVPNCINLLSASVDKNPIYIVMNYLEGGTLREIIDDTSGRGIPLKEAHQYLVEIGRALIIAHEAGITHCNIKPSNIIVGINNSPYISPLCRYQKTNEGYILSKFSLRTSDKASSYKEDLCYIAPEIFDNNYIERSRKERNEKIDQYMIGLLAYELLTGQIPTTVENLDILQAKRVDAFKTLEPVETIRKDCPSKFSLIIQRMIDKKPDNRFETLKQAINEIEKIYLNDVEVAKDSYARCIANKNMDVNFFEAFYKEFMRISPEAENKFKVLEESGFRNQFDKLRESIFILFLFADNKPDNVEPNVLTRIAQKHNKRNYDIPPPMYTDFMQALTNTVCGAPPFVVAYDEQCKKSENDKERIKAAWGKALEPGIEYMKKRYWEVNE